MTDQPLELGPQPLDDLMIERAWSNHDLVAASTEHLTHKMVGKGRRGRRLTRNAQRKLLNAVNALVSEDDDRLVLDDLFNYRGR